MASTYGTPEGSTLTDWPFGYEELAPYYERAEWEIGVAGEEGVLTARTPRSKPYPMPPLPGGRFREVYGAAADRLGWKWGPFPFALNSVPRFGGSVRRLPAMRRTRLPCGRQERHAQHARATCTGHRFCDLAVGPGGPDPHRRDATSHRRPRRVRHHDGPSRGRSCDRVIVSAGAVETPRLLQVSGPGNAWVGRNLHDHSGGMAMGLGPDPIQHPNGPATTSPHSTSCTATVKHGEAGSSSTRSRCCPSRDPAVGDVRCRRRRRRPQTMDARRTAPSPRRDEHRARLPSARSSVSADPHVRDRFGVPVARLEGHVHPASRLVEAYMAERCQEWLKEIGCSPSRALVRPECDDQPAAGEHSAGTCRMGHDPAHSACDPYGRVHGTENVYLADASLHPTNGSVNPALTVMANAFRVAELLLELRAH